MFKYIGLAVSDILGLSCFIILRTTFDILGVNGVKCYNYNLSYN